MCRTGIYFRGFSSFLTEGQPDFQIAFWTWRWPIPRSLLDPIQPLSNFDLCVYFGIPLSRVDYSERTKLGMGNWQRLASRCEMRRSINDKHF